MSERETPEPVASEPATAEVAPPAEPAAPETPPVAKTPAAAPPAAATPPSTDEEFRASRRRFFRQFTAELIQGAATVVGAATALQRSSAEAASAILDPEGGGSSGLLDILDPAYAAQQRAATEAPPILVDNAPRGFRTPFRFADDDRTLLVIDQRRLPEQLVEVPVRSGAEAADAISLMIVRGAPAIGQVAAIGLALTAVQASGAKPFTRRAILRGAAGGLKASRPTAVNLAWAVDRVMDRYEAMGELEEDGDAVARVMRAEADAIVHETTVDHGRLADFGVEALPWREGETLNILTHCNTGPLACGQFGTALGVVQAAHAADRPIHVWVDETRPYLQGARLTAWELGQAGVRHTLIADVAAGSLMARGKVDAILVGADRVAANGDTANKVGTYSLAVLAERHRIPFYVCAPLSSVDLETPVGAAIFIEERSPDEILEFRGQRIAPPGTDALNPAFDVTPASLIWGIVTEEGVIRAPFGASLVTAKRRRESRWATTPAFGDLASGTGG